jgi:aryl-alcohol dehydrogenase-like predicted oxidoreductase
MERLRAMGFTPDSLEFGGDWVELALRFTAYQPGVGVALIGGQNLGHIKDNIEIMKKGPLPQEIVDKIRQAWKEKDDGSWKGET